ncbi:peptide-methionine (S)-S-oxide reductase [Wenyingzhuangia sp. IMCC45467]
MTKIGLGGGCHWCTEAMFTFLKGVTKVDQGYIASADKNSWFSEGIIVYFNEDFITLKTILHIHLLTHQSTKNHSFRNKYRSAFYYFNQEQKKLSEIYLQELQSEFKETIITQILPFSEFKSSRVELLNYYEKDFEKPFCKSYIDPKLKLLINKFSNEVCLDKLTHLTKENK